MQQQNCWGILRAGFAIKNVQSVYFNCFGITIKYLDLGGGFPSPDFLDPYFDAVVEPILDGLKHDLPILILEPGRTIVKNAIDLITTVVGVREFPEGKRRIVVDAGINLLPTGFCP